MNHTWFSSKAMAYRTSRTSVDTIPSQSGKDSRNRGSDCGILASVKALASGLLGGCHQAFLPGILRPTKKCPILSEIRITPL
jgi:hypothetical protein